MSEFVQYCSVQALGASSLSSVVARSAFAGMQRRRAEMNEEKDKTQRKAESKVHQLEEKNKVCARACVWRCFSWQEQLCTESVCTWFKLSVALVH